MQDDLTSATRGVFHDIHLGHLRNPDSVRRLRTLLNPENLGLSADYFNDKVCADLGCGSAAHSTYNVLSMGAKYVHAMDTDGSFISSAKDVLGSEPAFSGRWQLDVGSVENLPYEDGKFDFVSCQGVIHHVGNDRKALEEIHRVLKKGGKISFSVAGKGGIINRFYREILRDEYQNNPVFSELVDKRLDAGWIQKQAEWLAGETLEDGTANYAKCISLLKLVKELIDDDFLLSLRDSVEAPVYKMYTEAECNEILHSVGYRSWYRVRSRPTYNNIRKLAAPLYFNYESELSRLFYGECALNIVATK